jgi:hypothetical protein
MSLMNNIFFGVGLVIIILFLFLTIQNSFEYSKTINICHSHGYQEVVGYNNGPFEKLEDTYYCVKVEKGETKMIKVKDVNQGGE